MSDQPDNRSGSSGVSGRLASWLESIASKLPVKTGRRRRIAPPPAPELLHQAARCYANARWDDDACRVFEQLGEDRRAAHFHELQERWEQAAACYARAGDWQGAARCYLRDNRPLDAAECLMKAGQTLQAAWTLADLAHHFRRAEFTARQFAAESVPDRLAVELIIARCEAGAGSSTEAAKRLKGAVTQFRDLPVDPRRQQLNEWAFVVAEALHRPDLMATIHAASVTSGLLRASEQWERWAMEFFGDTTGVPPPDIE